MWQQVLVFNLILCPFVISRRSLTKDADYDDGVGGDLIASLRDDANLDLPMDEEYEDLRAELLAYHTALASITGRSEDGPVVDLNEADSDSAADSAVATPGAPAPESLPNTRRSLKTTPCWKLGGICVYHKLCKGHSFTSEVYGCQRNLEVCCFTWNKYQTRDFKDHGISNLALPWGHREEFGGEGLISTMDKGQKSPIQYQAPQVLNKNAADDLKPLETSDSSESQEQSEAFVDRTYIKLKPKNKRIELGNKDVQPQIPHDLIAPFPLKLHRHPTNKNPHEFVARNRPLAIEYRVVPSDKQKINKYHTVKYDDGEAKEKKTKKQRETTRERLNKKHNGNQKPVLLIIKPQKK